MIKDGMYGDNEREIDFALDLRARALQAYPAFLKGAGISAEDAHPDWE